MKSSFFTILALTITLFGISVSAYANSTSERMQKAQQGDPVAQTDLGLMYVHGSQVKQSDTDAVKWFTLAAKQGYARGEMCLGMMYATGHGVKKDDAIAHKWFLAAAEQGMAMAQADAGQDYAEGWGTPKDTVQAYMWLSLAAARNATKVRTGLKALEHSMSPAQIAKAKRLAATWKPMLRVTPNADPQ